MQLGAKELVVVQEKTNLDVERIKQRFRNSQMIITERKKSMKHTFLSLTKDEFSDLQTSVDAYAKKAD